MNYNKILLVSLLALIGAYAAYYSSQNLFHHEKAKTDLDYENTKNEIPIEDSLFSVLVNENDVQINSQTKTITYSNADFRLKPELIDLYRKIGLINQTQNSIVIYPIFTESAYSKSGFYDFYKNKCDESCLTTKISNEFQGEYSASRAAFNSLRLLGYQYLTDIDIDKNPNILKKYDKVIVLHNEYVTRTEFDAIISHPKVLYLYPNALYAEVKSNYNDNTITLVRGHGYPQTEIKNGFDWKSDNTQFEYDNTCASWNFYETQNGKMLNCYPEYVIFRSESMLQQIKDY